VRASNLIFKMLKNSGRSSSSFLRPYVLKYRNRALKVTNTITIVVRELRVLFGKYEFTDVSKEPVASIFKGS